MKKQNAIKEKLMSIYDACLGVSSESDAFSEFYPGGSSNLIIDFETVLKDLKIDLPATDYIRKHIKNKIKKLIKNARKRFETIGYTVSDYPGENQTGDLKSGFIVNNIYGDKVKVECPLTFQDWSDSSTLGFILKMDKDVETETENAGLKYITPVIDDLIEILKPIKLIHPTVKADPGPGVGKFAWFVRFKNANKGA